jgi:hypothetical protein
MGTGRLCFGHVQGKHLQFQSSLRRLLNQRTQVGHNKMAPPIPEDVILSEGANDFRLQCFIQDPDQRPTAEALKAHPWLIMKRGWHFTGF